MIFADSSIGVCPVISLQYQYFLDDNFFTDIIADICNFGSFAISWSKGNYLGKDGDRRSFQTSGADTRIIQMEKPFLYLLLLLA